MKTQNSAAYDLSYFEEKPRIKALPQKQVVKAKHKSRTVLVQAILTLLASACVVSIVGFVLYNRAYYNELSDKVRKAEVTLNELKSEQVRLSMEVQTKTSLKNVEDYAVTSLGMEKIEKNQVEYMKVYDNDTVSTAKKSHFAIFDHVGSFFKNILEYVTP